MSFACAAVVLVAQLHRLAASAASTAVAAAAIAFLPPTPVAAAQAQDEEGEEDLDTARRPPERAKGSYPRIAAQFKLSDLRIERYQPTLVPLEGDRALLVYLGWKVNEGDRIFAAELAPDAAPQPLPVTPEVGQYLWPTGVLGPDGTPRLFWLAVEAGRVRLMTARRDTGGWSSPQPLADLVGCLSRPAAMVQGGRIWVAFENYVAPTAGDLFAGRKGGSDLFLAPLEGEQLGSLQVIGDGPFGDVEPAIASAPDGSLWIVWSQYDGRAFQVIARRFDPTRSEAGPPIVVSDDPLADDLHPTVRCTPDGSTWIAWDAFTDFERGRSNRHAADEAARSSEVKLRVACIRAGALLDVALPEGESSAVARTTHLSWSGGVPQLAFDPAGRLLLAHRYFEEEGDKGPSQSYPVLLQSASAAGWAEPRFLDGSEGALEEPALLSASHGLWIAAQADSRVRQVKTRLHGGLSRTVQLELVEHGIYLTGGLGPSHLRIAFLPWSDSPGAVASPTAAASPQVVARSVAAAPIERPHPLGAPEKDPLLHGGAHFAFADGDQSRFAFYGDLHRHSGDSRCLHGIEARPLDRYLFAREVFLDDFFALTDHPGHIDPLAWWQQCKLIDVAGSPAFCVFQGFEWSNNEYGHENVVFRHRTDSCIGQYYWATREPEGLWKLLPPGDAITIPHHPAHGKLSMDWDHVDPRFVRLVELFQSARGSFEFGGCYREATSAGASGCYVQDALDRGLEFGLIASSDHGNGAAYAIALADRLDHDAVFDAFEARRTLAATSKGLLVDFRVEGAICGQSVQVSAAPRISCHAFGLRELSDVAIFRDGTEVRVAGHEGAVVREPGKARLKLRCWFEGAAQRGRKEVHVNVAGGKVAWVPKERRLDRADRADIEPKVNPEADGPGGFVVRLGDAYRRSFEAKFDVEAAPEAVITVSLGGDVPMTTTLAQLEQGRAAGDDVAGYFVLAIADSSADPVDPARSLGTRDFHDGWTDTRLPAGRDWYYARVVDTAGEVCWSSPIFVTRE